MMNMLTVKQDVENETCWRCKGPIVAPFPCHKGCTPIEAIMDAIWTPQQQEELRKQVLSAMLYGVGFPVVHAPGMKPINESIR